MNTTRWTKIVLLFLILHNIVIASSNANTGGIPVPSVPAGPTGAIQQTTSNQQASQGQCTATWSPAFANQYLTGCVEHDGCRNHATLEDAKRACTAQGPTCGGIVGRPCEDVGQACYEDVEQEIDINLLHLMNISTKK